MKWTRAVFTAAFLALPILAKPADAEIILGFGIYASDKPTAMVKQFRPVLNVLEGRMTQIMGEPVRIRLQVAKTYENGVQALVSRRVDFARFGPASYIEAKESDSEIEILVVESKNSSKISKGVICVREDSPIKSINDVIGKTFAFGNERSTIGRYLSQLYLLRHNVRASKLAHYEYLGRHDKVGMAVGAGRYDAGALKHSTFKKLVASGVPLRIIGSFPNVTKPWIARSGLDGHIVQALREALLGLTDQEALKALKKDGFLEGSDLDYAFIREAILSNHLFYRDTYKQAMKPSDERTRYGGIEPSPETY